MAVILVDGFDVYNGAGAYTGVQGKWIVSQAAGIVSLVTGRVAGQALQLQNQYETNVGEITASRSFAANASVAVGFAVRYTTMPSGLAATDAWTLAMLLSGSTTMVGFKVNPNGSVEAQRMTDVRTGTSLGSASAAGKIVVNTWHYVELEVTISDTVGVFNLYVDGALILNFTGADTRNGSPTTVDTLKLGPANSSTALSGTNRGTVQIDDLYIVDSASKLGERRIETLYPISDVAQGFARSSGSTNYTLVDEAQVNGDTDYVQGVTGNVDTYGFGDVTGTPAAINAVQVSIFAEKTDVTTRAIAAQVKSGATTSDGPDLPLATSYGKLERLLTTDPNTSAAWAAAGVNALQAGPKVTV